MSIPIILPENQCIICCKNCSGIEIFSGSSHGTEHEQTCRKFFTLVSRYLHVNFDLILFPFKKTKTVKNITTEEEGPSTPKCSTFVCIKCVPLLESFCQTYHQWQQLELEVMWKLQRIEMVIQNPDGKKPRGRPRTRKIPSKRNKTETETSPPKKPLTFGEEFRERVLMRAQEKRKKTFPQLKLEVAMRPKKKKRRKVNLADKPVFPVGLKPQNLLMDSNVKTETNIEPSNQCLDDDWSCPVSPPIFETDGHESNNSEFIECRSRDAYYEMVQTPVSQPSMYIPEQSFNGFQNDDTKPMVAPLISTSRGSNQSEEFFSGLPASSNNGSGGAEEYQNQKPPYTCKFCGKISGALARHVEHVRVHTGEKPNICKTCGIGFAAKSSLGQHIRSMHSNQEVKFKFQCRFCETKFTRAPYRRIHEKFKCTKRPPDFDISLLDDTRMRRAGKQPGDHICSYCGKKFMAGWQLDQHERVHTGVRPFKCSTCNKRFTTKHGLVAHEVVHTSVKPFLCSYCEKTFVTKVALLKHEKTHTGEPDCFKCQYCWKSFDLASVCARHEKLDHHASDKPNLDGSSGPSSLLLMKTKKPKTIKPVDEWLQCQFCDKSFPYRFQLVEHETRHSDPKPFKCSCGKAYTSAAMLNIHKRNHTKLKPFKCSMCSKSFTSNSGLVQHENVHSKPFQCLVCGKRFAMKRVFAAHQSTHADQGHPPGGSHQEDNSEPMEVKAEVAFQCIENNINEFTT